MPQDEIEADGIRIAYERAGEGPSLLLCTATSATPRDWGRQLDELADAFTVVRRTRPGAGRSVGPARVLPPPALRRLCRRLHPAVGLERPHVARAVVRLRASAGALPALASDPAHARCWRLRTRAGRARSRPRRCAGASTGSSTRSISPRANGRRGACRRCSPRRAPRPPIEQLVLASPVPPRGAPGDGRSRCAEADLRDVLPRIDVATLLLYGEHDVRSPLPVAEALHAAIPGSRLVVLAGVGHVSERRDARALHGGDPRLPARGVTSGASASPSPARAA